jgi:hypothetical protein
MLNSGKKFRALRDKNINILTLVFYEKKILNETKNHNPPPLQVKWSVPKGVIGFEYLLVSIFNLWLLILNLVKDFVLLQPD